MTETRLFSKNMKCRKEVRRLYDASFPDDERIPWPVLTAGLNEHRRMYVHFDEGTFIGLSYVFLSRDIAYLGYLAVEEHLRLRGYGSQILQALRSELSDFRFVIDIEVVTKEAGNYAERKKRREFYLRNGFVSTGAGYYFYHVDYELLCAGAMVTADEFRDLIIEHWGHRARHAVFKVLKSDDES
ncbi:MAG: GNAT family N-acetyltransferase [Solobacterium sp.]|nr:GNAT family N-acetyltransferase [Solobacterium sp.]